MKSSKIREDNQFTNAKRIFTIPEAWVALQLPGFPARSCRSPFREDRCASFSIFDEERRFKDFATGDHGDVVDFVALARGCSLSEACNWILSGRPEVGHSRYSIPKTLAPDKKTRRHLKIPSLNRPNARDIERLAVSRNWGRTEGMTIAADRGLLFSCNMSDNGVARRAWAITDSARRSIQVRRMDGQPWGWNRAKAWTLGGSIAGWPIGAADIGDRHIVFFCEGGPDFLAAHTLAWLADRVASVAVVCVPGATASLHPDALPFFAKKHVRILEHADVAGSDAGQRWAAQLKQAGATVDGFTFDAPHKDLADLLAATNGESLNCPADVFKGLPKKDASCR